MMFCSPTVFVFLCFIFVPSTDETYTSFLPTNSLPLNELLGTKMYFELNLISKYPEAILIVKYCLAYPRSAKNALVLIYKGSASISTLGEFECISVRFDLSCHLLGARTPTIHMFTSLCRQNPTKGGSPSSPSSLWSKRPTCTSTRT